MTETSTPTKSDDKRIYVDDPDGKQFYEYQNHDAMALQTGDLFVSLGKLHIVKEVKRKQGQWTVTLENGFSFDPTRDYLSKKDPQDLRRMTFWRPRAAFRGSF